jgi:hypothetical protein
VVVDYWNRPIDRATVEIDGDTYLTGPDGLFEFEDVPTPYDISATILAPREPSIQQKQIWIYQGLTRADPTLQIYRARTRYSREIDITATGITDVEIGERALWWGYSADFEWYGRQTTAADPGTTCGWMGSATVSGTFHSLLWDTNASDLPSVYHSHTAQDLMLDYGAAANPVVSYAAAPMGTITSAAITGTTNYTGVLAQYNLLYLRWNDGAVFPINEGIGSNTDTINYLVPMLPEMGASVAASAGFWGEEFAIAHEDGVIAGTTGIELTIPDTPLIISPSGGETLEDGDLFRYNPTEEGNVHVLVFEAEDWWEYVYVVTTATEISVDTINASNFPFRGADSYLWHVEWHGAYESVDEATGESGFLDSWAMFGTPSGPAGTTGQGAYASSDTYQFTAP